MNVQQHLGDADAQMIAEISERMEKYVDKQVDATKKWLRDQLNETDDYTSKQLKQIENLINSKAIDSSQFQVALKGEIEELGEF